MMSFVLNSYFFAEAFLWLIVSCNKKFWNDNEKNTGYGDYCRTFG